MRSTLSLRSAAFVALLYVLLAIALTWPVAAHLTTLVPGDLGDPLLNMWILGWDLDHLTRFFSGELGAWRAPFGHAVSDWLSARGANRLASSAGDVLFELPAVTDPSQRPTRGND